ncbi:ubiquitin-like domain-containing protein [Halobacillus yeomjeoni]|uniref:DUF348 domain-containing protein n=1 Tax=Halobacillus yeomjeoni TaxID=311194 RepID=A0A931HYX1_9BACI|nr:G5 and 3D domain-containing protein [Halobacillus yeomjeoni]MBH0231850.1 DUF348 domain-containing protein [Halobacillus yeomjeoni]MCA0985645.1 ubiquitin-like domain-containing protein [Halobacillus yeomjeoni]
MGKKNDIRNVLKSKVLWIAVLTIFSFSFLVTVSYEATKASVQVTLDGESELIRTHSNTVGDLLSELDVTVQQHDELSHDLSTPISYGMDLQYIASKSINLAIDDQPFEQYFTTTKTVEEFFQEQNLDFQKRDDISHKQGDPIESGMKITVNQAMEITLNDGGDKKKVWTTASTVDEFLSKQGVQLNELDELKPAKTEELKAGVPVKINRIEKVTDIVEEEVDFTVETRKDDSLLKGKKRVVSDGEKGLITKKYEVTLKNGEEVKRELIEESVEKESQKKIVAVGTKVNAPARSTSDRSSGSSSRATTTVSRGDTNGAKTLYMHSTAYTANCTGCSGITAIGINLKANPGRKVVAVDPSVIPLGTRVWVEGYGYAIAGDTGGAIKGNRIDLFIPSKSQALSYGRRSVKVKILD